MWVKMWAKYERSKEIQFCEEFSPNNVIRTCDSAAI